jgi:DNA-binding response OmpR family regulator
MPSHPLLVFIVPVDAPQTKRHRIQMRAPQLAAQGFQLQVCDDAPSAHDHVDAARARGVAAVAVLAGNRTQNSDAARYVRALCPDAGVLVLMHTRNDAACVQILHSGADAYCPANVSTPLLVAVLFSLLRRLARASSRTATVLAPDDGGWSLHEGGSVLIGPAGRIPLTTGERAFVATLLSADGLRASHRQLIDAVNACYPSAAPRTHQARLGVLISRLRKKFGCYGYDMPLKSVHNWGYMFTGHIASVATGAAVPKVRRYSA